MVFHAGRCLNAARHIHAIRPRLPNGFDHVAWSETAGKNYGTQHLSLTGTKADTPNAVIIQPDGNILVAGTSNTTDLDDIFIARFRPDGSSDPSFNFSGLRFYDLTVSGNSQDRGFAMALTPEGITVAGDTGTGVNGTDFAVLRVVRDNWVIVSADQGGPPTVKIFTPTGTLLFQFDAYGSVFTGGVRTAAADITGDGVPDILTAPGPGGAPFVNIFDGGDFHLIVRKPR